MINKKVDSACDMSGNVCRHVAIIMDGNGRWAKKRFLPRFMGHKSGANAVKRIVIAAQALNVEVLTLYAFSTENWKRPAEEISFLMELLHNTIEKEFSELVKQGVCLNFIGDWRALPKDLVEKIENILKESSHNSGLKLNIALNYGGRQDIVNAAKILSEQVLLGKLVPDDITEDLFEQQLELVNESPVDLLIRTSGEMRLSNFLLWQLAYSEFYFTDKLWPDFDADDLAKAIANFNLRKRRFGDV